MEPYTDKKTIEGLKPIKGSKEKARAFYELEIAMGLIEYAIIWKPEDMSIKTQSEHLKDALERLKIVREVFK
jgi:hypothetical protein